MEYDLLLFCYLVEKGSSYCNNCEVNLGGRAREGGSGRYVNQSLMVTEFGIKSILNENLWPGYLYIFPFLIDF